MFERVLYDVLSETLEQVAGDTRALQRFVDSLPLEDDVEKNAVMDLVQVMAGRVGTEKPPVRQGYPRDDTTFPCWCIVLSNEEESLQALGDDTGDDDEDGNPIRASVWTSTHQILTYSENPDLTLYLYTLLKAIMLERRLVLIDRGCLTNLSTMRGVELAPDQVYLPAFLFVRGLSVTAEAEQGGLQLLGPPEGSSHPLRAIGTAGLHIDDGSEYATVTTGITPYAPEE